MNHSKQPERRTYLQDRLEILIKKQRSGKATFNELTELDAIVNSDPEIRKRIIMESMLMDDPDGFNEPLENFQPEIIPHAKISLFNRLKSFIHRVFTSQFPCMKIRIMISIKSNPALL